MTGHRITSTLAVTVDRVTYTDDGAAVVIVRSTTTGSRHRLDRRAGQLAWRWSDGRVPSQEMTRVLEQALRAQQQQDAAAAARVFGS